MALSAAQYAFLKLTLRAFSSANRYIVANLSESDLLAFWNQLATEAATGSALSAAKDAAIDQTFRSLLSASNLLVGLPNADWTSFFSQLSTDSTGVAALPASQYAALKLQLRATLSSYAVAPGTVSDADLLGYLKPRVPAGSPLTIITSSPPKIWVDSQLGTGANAWADQSANGNGFAEATNPPTLTTIGGVPCYLFNGTNQKFLSPLTVTSGQWYWVIAQQISWISNGSLCGGATSGRASVLGTGSAPELSYFSGVLASPNSGATVGSWFRFKWLCTGTGSDYFQIGSNRQTASGGGTSDSGGWFLGCRAGIAFGNFAVAAVVACAAEPTAPEQAALDAYGAARWPAVGF